MISRKVARRLPWVVCTGPFFFIRVAKTFLAAMNKLMPVRIVGKKTSSRLVHVPRNRHLMFFSAQLGVGVIVNLIVPFAFFSLILLPGAPFVAWSGTTVFTIVSSPIITALLAPLFLPIALVSGLSRRMVRPTRMDNTHFLLRPGRSVVRHGLYGVALAFTLSPMLFVISVLMTPINGFVFIICISFYISMCTVCILPPALLVLSTHANLQHMCDLMHGKTFFYKVWACMMC
jgi:hypothetical protein